MILIYQRRVEAVWSQGTGLDSDNLNCYKLSQLSGLQLGTTSEERGNAREGGSWEGAKSQEFRNCIQLLADAVKNLEGEAGSQLRDSTGMGCMYGCRLQSPALEVQEQRYKETIGQQIRTAEGHRW